MSKNSKKKETIINHKIYIRNVLKQIHPDLSISEDTLSQINFFIYLLGLHIAKEAEFLINKDYMINIKESTNKEISTRTIQTAVRLSMPGELAKHAVSEGTKALSKFHYSKPNTTRSPVKKSNSKKIRKEKYAGLVFPISRSKTLIKSIHNGQVSGGSPIYLAAVLEYISAELLELSGNKALDNNRRKITAQDVMDAIKNDEELYKLTKIVGWSVLGGI